MVLRRGAQVLYVHDRDLAAHHLACAPMPCLGQEDEASRLLCSLADEAARTICKHNERHANGLLQALTM
eukprot:9487458-Lingulodinium_polyedra.AAC.1